MNYRLLLPTALLLGCALPTCAAPKERAALEDLAPVDGARVRRTERGGLLLRFNQATQHTLTTTDGAAGWTCTSTPPPRQLRRSDLRSSVESAGPTVPAVRRVVQ